MWNKFKDILASLSPQEQKNTHVKLSQTRRSRAFDAVRKLQSCYGRRFSYQKASLVNCNSCQANLIALYTHIADINTVVKSGKALSPVDFTCEVAEYCVSDLLINDGMYIPLDIVKMYCAEAMDLCSALEVAEGEMAGPMAYNMRVLAIQLGTIREVCTAITACYSSK